MVLPMHAILPVSLALSPVRSFRRKAMAAAALIAGFAAAGLQAQTTYTWTGTGGNVNFSTAGNWDTLPPDPANTTVNLTFSGSTNTGTLTTPLLQNVTNSYRVDDLIFAANAGAYFIGGNTGSRTFNLRGNPTIQNLSTTSKQTLLLGLNITNTVNITGASTNAAIELSGNIVGNAGASLRLASSDTYLILSGSNSGYNGTGRVQIDAGGILGINNNNALISNPTDLATQYLEITSSADGTRLRAETTDRTVANGIVAAADFTLEGSNDLTFSGSASLNTAAGALAVSVTSGNRLTFAGNTQRTGATAALVTKAGAGTLALGTDLADTVTGFSAGITVSEGTLLIEGTAAGLGTVTVADGATVGGNGSLTFASNTNLAVNGTLTAGEDGTGTLAMSLAGTGKLSFSSSSTYEVMLGGANDGLISFSTPGDWLAITSGATLSIIDGGGLQNGVWYTLASGLTTAPSVDFELGGGLEGIFQLSGGNYQVQLVPEPQAAVLAGMGLVVLLSRFRRRAH